MILSIEGGFAGGRVSAVAVEANTRSQPQKTSKMKFTMLSAAYASAREMSDYFRSDGKKTVHEDERPNR